MVPMISFFVGGLNETFILIGLAWMYNDLQGADEHWFLRNVINAAGFMGYSSGVMKVALLPHRLLFSSFMSTSTSTAAKTAIAVTLNNKSATWLVIIGFIILTTVQIHDLPDIEGDRARDRQTAPLVLGEGVTRWSIAISVAAWSIVCPMFWDLSWLGYIFIGIPGVVVAGRVLWLTGSVKSDKKTLYCWCLWTIAVYFLPLFVAVS